MKRGNRKKFYTGIFLLATFVFWTVAVCIYDVQPIGPRGSSVGFAALNGAFHRLTGVHMTLYVLTDWLSLVPVGIMFCFAVLGLVQWVRRKRLCKVDRSILVLGAFYVLVLLGYLLFEELALNARPVLIENVLEASYPSSTTVLVLCTVPTAILQLHERMPKSPRRRWISAALAVFAGFMVLARLLSGVHWLTDIVGGVLLSAGLVFLYAALAE